MPNIEEIKFGSITVDGQKYGQVVIAGGQAQERNRKLLEEEFGSMHKISQSEGEKLLEFSPEYIVIGDGFDGMMEIQPEIMEKLQKSGAKTLVLHSPIAIQKYNELIKQGKKVNALIHTTC